MNCQSESIIQQQSETLETDPIPLHITPLQKIKYDEPVYHSSQTKRPILHFDDQSLNNLENNDIEQTFNSIYTHDFSKLSKSLISKMNNQNLNLNSSNNSNTLNINKSVQQEKYDSIKNYCLKKNDPDSYPLISYENFLLVDCLLERNEPEFEPYKNFLLNKSVSIELISKFCTLLMNRFIFYRQNKTLNKYPKVVYQIIFDINNVYNYLSPDIVADAKQSNMFLTLINYENKWNVLAINQNNNFCNYFMFNKNMDKEIILSLMNTITQTIYPHNNFTFNVSDYSGFSQNNQVILPFIIMEFFSRYKSNLPNDDEDYYYQTILILSEIMTCKLITK